MALLFHTSNWSPFATSGDRLPFDIVSPVPHLQLCNDPPSPNEEQLVHQALVNAENQRRRILAEMKHRAIWELIDNKTLPQPPELKALDEFIHSLRGVLSPMRKLPFELLQLVFMLAFDAEAFDAQKHWPYTLSRVCRRWRQICIATPTLWKYLPRFTLDSRISGFKARRRRKFFAELIERSRGSLIHIYVEGSYSSATSDPILEMLVREAHRWEFATLELRWPTFQALFSPIKGRLQQLRRLSFHLYDDYRSPRTVPILLDMFSGTPRMEHADIKLKLEHERLVVPPNPSAPRAIRTFIHKPHLHSLSLNLPLSTGIQSRIVLPGLKRFQLYVQEDDNPIALDAFVFPALEELIVGLKQMPLRTDIYPFVVDFVRRSSASSVGIFPVKRLHLQMTSPPAYFVISMIDLLPALKSLEFRLGDDSGRVLRQLACTERDFVLAPQLEVMSPIYRTNFITRV
ncbi:hypothetical protein CVT24_009833, partial [Panaeolus cyanescens]